jgi:hypothetical protein
MQTSFKCDSARIEQSLKVSSFPGRYALDVPGPGLNLPMQDDTQLRMQTWGANRGDNFVNLESDLRGMTRRLNRDQPEANNYRDHAVVSRPLQNYSVADPFVQESRASHPAFMYRGVSQDRWEQPWLNPQAPVDKDFYDNIQTRILEKDYYTPNYTTH